jgi:pimeloyl-ACP methyl ester carboxylesterase
MSIPTLPGIFSHQIETDRLQIHLLSCGPEDGIPVIFVHGNVSSATFWEETMLALPDGYRALAPDLRGYGFTEAKPIDATQGLGDMADDLHALVVALGIGRHHIVGHSMGGGVVMKYALTHAADLLSITLVNPISPYGYGGSKDVEGTMTYDDGSPTGINPEFVQLLAAGERERRQPDGPH